MNKLIIAFLIITNSLLAQEKRIQKTSDFQKLKVYNGLQVSIQKSNTSYVEIIGNEADRIIVKNDNGVLSLRLKLRKTHHNKTKIKVHYNSHLTFINAKQKSEITSNEALQQKSIELKAQGGAFISLVINTDIAKVNATTGATIELVGNVKKQEVKTVTGGKFYGYNLQSTSTLVTSGYGGKAYINTSELLDAKAIFGGCVYYKKVPKLLQIKKGIGGIIKRE